jgi:hypothetical protein
VTKEWAAQVMFKGGATVALSLNANGMLIFGNDPKVVGGGQISEGIPTSMLADELLRRQQNFEVAHARSKIAKVCRADTPAKERVVSALVSEQAEELPVGETGEILQEALDEFMSVLTSAAQLSTFEEQTAETDEKSSVPALAPEVYAACGETSDAEGASDSDPESVDFQSLAAKLGEVSSPEDLAALVGALRLAKAEEEPPSLATTSKAHAETKAEEKDRLATRATLHEDALAREQLAQKAMEAPKTVPDERNGFEILDSCDTLHGTKTGKDNNNGPTVNTSRDPREEMWMPRLLRQHLRATDGQTPGSTDLMDAYESPVIPEVDVVERPVRGSVPELASDSESEQSEEVPDELLFDSLRSSLESYRIAEQELLRHRNKYRDLQNQAAERESQTVKRKEVPVQTGKGKEVRSELSKSTGEKEVNQAARPPPEKPFDKVVHTGLSLHSLVHSSDDVTFAMARETAGLWVVPAGGGRPVTGADIRMRDIQNRPKCQICDQTKMKHASSSRKDRNKAARWAPKDVYALDAEPPQPFDIVAAKFGPDNRDRRHQGARDYRGSSTSEAPHKSSRRSVKPGLEKSARTCSGQAEYLLKELAELLKPAAPRTKSSRRHYLTH